MKLRHLSYLSLATAATVVLAGCAADTEAETVGDGNSDQRAMTIAVFNGWDEGIAASELWKAVLESKGYAVELEYADPAPVFVGLAAGDYDVNFDIWLPNTHKSYLETYGDDIVDLGAWNEESKNTIAVNADAPIDSLTELADNADLFSDRIIGIEAGAGLTEIVGDSVIPAYGLEDMDFVTSSMTAMLAELSSATASGENIVVTLAEPHWAYREFPLKNLEDPEGALGGTEGIHSYSSTGFEAAYPQAAEWIGDFEMDLEMLYSLEGAMFIDYDGSDYGPVVEKWIGENQEYVDALTS